MGLVLLLLNVPGQIVVGPDIFGEGQYGPHFELWDYCEHGWPFTFSRRETWRRDYWQSNWNVFAGVEKFHASWLIVDAIIGAAILSAAGFLFKAWRRRRQRFLQFYIGDLLVLIGFVAACCAVYSFHRSRHRYDRNILQAIDKIEDQSVQWGIKIDQRAEWQPGGPSLLRRLIGDRPFKDLDRVVGFHAAGEEIEQVVKLPNLKLIRIDGMVSNRRLKMLERLSHLEALDLCNAGLDEEGHEIVDADGNIVEQFFRLPKLPRLRGLNLYGTAFRGEGLENIPSIEVLDLTETDMTDEGAQKLADLRYLKVLSLDGTQVTDDGVRHISTLKHLEKLWLGSTAIGNDGLHHLSDLLELRSLAIYGNRITDAAIPALKRFTKLEYLELQKTEVSQDGFAELRRALPDCYIP